MLVTDIKYVEENQNIFRISSSKSFFSISLLDVACIFFYSLLEIYRNVGWMTMDANITLGLECCIWINSFSTLTGKCANQDAESTALTLLCRFNTHHFPACLPFNVLWHAGLFFFDLRWHEDIPVRAHVMSEYQPCNYLLFDFIHQ